MNFRQNWRKFKNLVFLMIEFPPELAEIQNTCVFSVFEFPPEMAEIQNPVFFMCFRMFSISLGQENIRRTHRRLRSSELRTFPQILSILKDPLVPIAPPSRGSPLTLRRMFFFVVSVRLSIKSFLASKLHL